MVLWGILLVKKIISVLSIFVVSFFLASCGGTQNEIYIAGSTTISPVMLEIVEAFENANPQYKVVVESVGSSAGVVATGNNSSHIGMVSRPLLDDELKDVEPFFLCKEPIVLIVNKEAALEEITKEELIALYIENKPVGDISKAVAREEDSGLRQTFSAETTIDQKAPLPATVDIQGDSSKIKRSVIYDATKLGYIDRYSLDDTVKALRYSNDGTNYFEPTIENIQNGTYTLCRPFYLIVPKSLLKGSTQIFLDFCRSTKAKEIMFANGYVPVG